MEDSLLLVSHRAGVCREVKPVENRRENLPERPAVFSSTVNRLPEALDA